MLNRQVSLTIVQILENTKYSYLIEQLRSPISRNEITLLLRPTGLSMAEKDKIYKAAEEQNKLMRSK